MADKFVFEIDSLGAEHGWADCYLTFNGERHQLYATSVFPPFGDILSFARAIASNSLPHQFFWDEEGHGAEFYALPVEGESKNFHLRIAHDEKTIIDAELERMSVTQTLLSGLRNFALDCPGAEGEWEFPYFLIEGFEHDLVQGCAVNTNSQPVRTANFVFGHFGGFGGQASPSFHIWIDARHTLFVFMDDTPHLWWEWFDLLEKIGRGDLPIQKALQRDENIERNLFLMFGRDVEYYFEAQPVAQQPDVFRLKLSTAMPRLEVEDDISDDILDRRQFVGAFIKSLEDFLHTNYLAFLESGGITFDLRSLPVERLREML